MKDKKGKKPGYDIDEYRNDGTLLPGIFMILICLYLSRYLLYGPLSLIASRRGFGNSNAKFDLSFMTVDSPFEMLTSIPAVLVLFVMLARTKKSKAWIRWIWANGSHMLQFCAVTQFGLLVVDFVQAGKLVLVLAVGAVFNLYVLYYVFANQRVKDVFAMFPE